MTKGKLSLIVASLAVATGLFWARMLISPPISEAATNAGVDPGQITRNASTNLPTFKLYLSETYGSVGQASLRSSLRSDGLRMPRMIR